MAINDSYFSGYLDSVADPDNYIRADLIASEAPGSAPLWRKYELVSIEGGTEVTADREYGGFGHEHEIQWRWQWEKNNDPAVAAAPGLTLPVVLPFQLTVEIHDDLAETNLLFRQVISGNITITAWAPSIPSPTPGVDAYLNYIDAYSFTHTVNTDVQVSDETPATTTPDLDNGCPTEYDNGESMPFVANDGTFDYRVITAGTVIGENTGEISGIVYFYEGVIIFQFKSAPYMQDYETGNVVKLSYEYFANPIPPGLYNSALLIRYREPLYGGVDPHREFKLRLGRTAGLGLFTDIASAVHTAVSDSEAGGVQVYKFADGIGTRTARALMAGLRNPCIWTDDQATRYLCAQSTNGTWELYVSHDDGRTFTFMAFPWTDGYKGGNEFPLIDGGAGSCKIKVGTDPAEVWFRRSPDSTSWPADAPYGPVPVGTLGSDHKSVNGKQKTESGETTLVISNGYDKTWRSEAMGAEGSWVLDT